MRTGAAPLASGTRSAEAPAAPRRFAPGAFAPGAPGRPSPRPRRPASRRPQGGEDPPAPRVILLVVAVGILAAVAIAAYTDCRTA